MNKENRINKCACTIIFIVGLILSILIPTWQTPDEPAHLEMIGQSIKNDSFAMELKNDIAIKTGRIEFHPEKKVKESEQKEALLTPPQYTKREMMPKGITLDIIKHFPATCGILLGILMGIPTYWALQLGEWTSLLFYTAICYYTLKKMPIKKEIMFLIMASPIALQQAGSLGYDCIVISLSFFFISDILYLKFEKTTIQLKDIFASIVVLMVITYIKVPYVFFGMLYILIPLEKIQIRVYNKVIDEKWIRKYGRVFLLIGCICAIGCIYYLKNNRWIQVLYGMVVEWRRAIYLLEQTITTWHEHIIVSSVGNFGWLDTPMLYGCAIGIYLFIFLFAFVNLDKAENKKFTVMEAGYIFIVFCVLFLMILLSMVNHTIMVTLFGSEQSKELYNIREALYQIPYIGGLQGRYFLPFLPLLFLPLPTIKEVKKHVIMIGIIVGEVCIMGYTIFLLLNRYWI